MNNKLPLNDSVMEEVKELVETCARNESVELLSMVLYGPKARGEHISAGAYEVLLIFDNGISLNSYTKVNYFIKLELLRRKMHNVNISAYTPDIFENILYEDRVMGTFLYMICREHIVFYDRQGTFAEIKERMACSPRKSEEEFLSQCVEFARSLGSVKWEQRWEKALMQLKYSNKPQRKRNSF